MYLDKVKFTKNFLIFITLFLIIFFFINNIYIDNIQNNKVIYRKQKEWNVYKSNLDNNVLKYGFFGDSHVRNSLNPNIIKNSFNFGTSAENYIETYYKIKNIYEKDNIYIENVILQIDMHTFKKNKIVFKEISYYSDFVDLNVIAKYRSETFLETYLKNKLPIIGNGKDFYSFFINKSNLKSISLGWEKDDRIFSKKEDINQISYNKFKHHFSDFNYDILNNDSFIYFLKTIKFLKNKNANIIFISYPVSENYYNYLIDNNISKNKYYYKIFNNIKDLNINYKFYDYSKFIKNNKYFADADHLNYLGSYKLSKDLYIKLKNI